MVILKQLPPSLRLASYVRMYRIIQFTFSSDVIIPAKAYPPRPEHCLQFGNHVCDISYSNKKSVRLHYVFLSGQHTQTCDRFVGHHFLALQIVFQPGALFRLTGLPMNELTNQTIDAEQIFGKEILDINEQICTARDHSLMVYFAEQFVISLLQKRIKELHPIDRHLHLMYGRHKENHIDWLVDSSCLSHRQFDRKFMERTGVNAREFMRVIRFYEAYLLKNKYPHRDWLSIAVASGYYDYQHLAKDYKEFTGHTPKKFFALDSPERSLGREETVSVKNDQSVPLTILQRR